MWISTARPIAVVEALARSWTPTSWDSRVAMTPEPTTTVTRRPVPSSSAKRRRHTTPVIGVRSSPLGGGGVEQLRQAGQRIGHGPVVDPGRPAFRGDQAGLAEHFEVV